MHNNPLNSSPVDQTLSQQSANADTGNSADQGNQNPNDATGAPATAAVTEGAPATS